MTPSPEPIIQTHPVFQNRSSLVLQLDNLLLAWLIHTPFLSPSLAPRRKETETRGFASRQVAVLCEAYEKREKKGERFFGEAWQREPGAHLRSSGSQSWMICLEKPSAAKRRISCAQVPMEPKRGGEGFQRLPHPCTTAYACMHVDAHAQKQVHKHMHTYTRTCSSPMGTETMKTSGGRLFLPAILSKIPLNV